MHFGSSLSFQNRIYYHSINSCFIPNLSVIYSIKSISLTKIDKKNATWSTNVGHDEYVVDCKTKGELMWYIRSGTTICVDGRDKDLKLNFSIMLAHIIVHKLDWGLCVSTRQTMYRSCAHRSIYEHIIYTSICTILYIINKLDLQIYYRAYCENVRAIVDKGCLYTW